MRLPPFHWWRTTFFLVPAIALYTIVLGVISLTASLIDRRGHVSHWCAQWWARLIVWTTGVRITREGTLPPTTESCIFVANHASIYDIPILFSSLPHQLRIIAKAALFYVPFIGWHLRWAGHLLVDRSKPGANIFKRMQRLTTQEASLIVFPEGSRSSDGRVRKFKGGIFLLAIETGWPIVPISVIGSRVVMPKNRFMTCPGDVRVVVHPLIPTKGLTREDARGLADRARQIVAAAVPGGEAGGRDVAADDRD